MFDSSEFAQPFYSSPLIQEILVDLVESLILEYYSGYFELTGVDPFDTSFMLEQEAQAERVFALLDGDRKKTQEWLA